MITVSREDVCNDSWDLHWIYAGISSNITPFLQYILPYTNTHFACHPPVSGVVSHSDLIIVPILGSYLGLYCPQNIRTLQTQSYIKDVRYGGICADLYGNILWTSIFEFRPLRLID